MAYPSTINSAPSWITKAVQHYSTLCFKANHIALLDRSCTPNGGFSRLCPGPLCELDENPTTLANFYKFRSGSMDDVYKIMITHFELNLSESIKISLSRLAFRINHVLGLDLDSEAAYLSPLPT